MRNKLGNVLWGVALILLGVAFAGDAFNLWNFELFFPGWWTLFIIIPCMISMVQSGLNAVNLIALVVGIMLLISSNGYLPRHIVGKLIFPFILVAIGVNILLSGKTRQKLNHGNCKPGQDGFINIVSVFGSQDSRPTNEVVSGASIISVFGGAVLDLRQATITDGVVVDISVIFAGVDILLPPTVNAKVRSLPIFGGVDDKSIHCLDPNAPTIYINANCIFGGVDIK